MSNSALGSQNEGKGREEEEERRKKERRKKEKRKEEERKKERTERKEEEEPNISKQITVKEMRIRNERTNEAADF